MMRLGFCLLLGCLMATLTGAAPAPVVEEMVLGSVVEPLGLSSFQEAPLCLDGIAIEGAGQGQDSGITTMSCNTYLQCVEGYFQCASGCYYYPCGTVCEDWYNACLANLC